MKFSIINLVFSSFTLPLEQSFIIILGQFMIFSTGIISLVSSKSALYLCFTQTLCDSPIKLMKVPKCLLSHHPPPAELVSLSGTLSPHLTSYSSSFSG